MKRLIFALLSIVSLTSCSIDDDNQTLQYELVPVTEVEIPDTLAQGETYTFTVTYERPTDCYEFVGFEHNRNENEFVIGVVNYRILEETNCTEEVELTEVPLEFYVESDEMYTFKFWTGSDDVGQPEYIIYEVPVEAEGEEVVID